MTKFTQLLINIGIGVGGFFAFALLQNAANGAFWLVLLFAALAAAGYFLRNTASSEALLSVWTYIFSYGCIYAFLGVIKWLSEGVCLVFSSIPSSRACFFSWAPCWFSPSLPSI